MTGDVRGFPDSPALGIRRFRGGVGVGVRGVSGGSRVSSSRARFFVDIDFRMPGVSRCV